MHPSKLLLCSILGVTLCAAAGAGAGEQIYESKDAKGNAVFSDTPSHGAEAVDLAPTNSADPVEERPRPEPDTAVENAAQRPSGPDTDHPQEHGYQHDHDDDSYYYGGTYNNNNDDAADSRSERRQQRRNDGNQPDRPGNDRPQVDHRSGSSRASSGMRGR